MAARVVYLVVTGSGAPRPGPRPDLHHQGRRRAPHVASARRWPRPVPRRRDRARTADRRARADRLHLQRLRRRPAHRARPAHRPRARHPGDHATPPASSSAPRVIARYTGRVHHLTDHAADRHPGPPRARRAMSEHLVTPDEVRAFHAASGPASRPRRLAWRSRARTEQTHRGDLRQGDCAIDRGASCSGWSTPTGRLKADLGLMDFSDQIRSGAPPRRRAARGGEAERDKFRVVLLDEYQDTSVAQALLLSRLFSGPDADRSRARRDGGRRPQPGDLRLAGRLGRATSSTSPRPSRPPTATSPIAAR